MSRKIHKLALLNAFNNTVNKKKPKLSARLNTTRGENVCGLHEVKDKKREW